MIQIVDKKECCGCSACVQVCPHKCISFKEDEEGFSYPIVDEKVCNSCGWCELVCPIIKEMKNQNQTQKNLLLTYVAYAKNEAIRKESSSGGIFSLLAEEIILEGGVVFGAAFDEFFSVKHIAVDDMESLNKLRGSKYMQSYIGNCFVQVRDYLKQNRTVLFSGTPCQIAGLKSFLHGNDSRLITIDILCHGVPSQSLWKSYLREQQSTHGSTVEKVLFRNKKTGWKTYSMQLRFNNTSEYCNVYTKDAFMRMFLSDICLRPSCYACEFKQIERMSDITIGDCWGIDKIMPDMDDDKGTSIVLIHSLMGKELFSRIFEKTELREANCEHVLPPTSASRVSVTRHPRRNQFFRELRKGASIKKLEKIAEKREYMAVKYMKKIIHKIKKSLNQ